jgi:hypothetical protein
MTVKRPPAGPAKKPTSDSSQAPAKHAARASSPELDEKHRRMLRELAEMGMDMLRGVHQRALENKDSTTALVEAVDDFERISRAVRQTLMLEHKLAESRPIRRGNAAPAPVDEIDSERQARHKIFVKRAVEKAILTEKRRLGLRKIETLLADLDERLEDADIGAHLAKLPVGAIALRLCTEFGLAPDLSLWAEEPWAIKEALTRPPGSPFAARRDAGPAAPGGGRLN